MLGFPEQLLFDNGRIPVVDGEAGGHGFATLLNCTEAGMVLGHTIERRLHAGWRSRDSISTPETSVRSVASTWDCRPRADP
jgi:hypothetical protein